MGNLVQVKLKLRNSDSIRTMQQLARVSPRCASHIVNKFCFQVARKVVIAMPEVAPGKMDSELMAYKVPVYSYSRKGNLLGKGKARATFFGASGIGKHPSVPLLALIINARVLRVDNSASSQPGMSRYNRLTGMAFARESSPFRGKSRAAGAAAMLDAMRRVLAVRHKSSGFYKLGARVVQFIFHRNYLPFAGPPVEGGGAQIGGGSGPVSKAIGRVAGGTRAEGNSDFARASFWVSTTEPDSKGANTAISKLLQPVWQAAVDAETESTRRYAEELFAKAARSKGLEVSR